MSIPSAWPQVLDFFGTPLVIEPSTGQLSSDAGLLPVRQFDQRIGLTRAVSDALDARRDSNLTEHTFLELVRSRVSGILASYEDQNDHDTLRHDPVFKLVADRSSDDPDEAILAAIHEDPDDTLRLVFAGWLDEWGRSVAPGDCRRCGLMASQGSHQTRPSGPGTIKTKKNCTDCVVPFFGNEVGFAVNAPVFRVRSCCDFNLESHPRRLAVHEYSNGRPNAQEANMIRTFARLVTSGSLQPRWGEQPLTTQQVIDACLGSAQQDGKVVTVLG